MEGIPDEGNGVSKSVKVGMWRKMRTAVQLKQRRMDGWTNRRKEERKEGSEGGREGGKERWSTEISLNPGIETK